MTNFFINYFPRITIGVVVVASLLGLARYRQLPPSLRWLVLLACFDVVCELACIAVSRLLNQPNLFLFPFITVGEVMLLSFAYRQVLRSAGFIRVLPWLLGLLAAYALLDSLLQLGVVRFAVSLGIISNLWVLGLAGLYFRKLLNELYVQSLRHDPFFWVSVALAGYGLGNVLISLCSNYVLAHCSLLLQHFVLGVLRNVFNVVLYAAYCLAFCLRRPLPSYRAGAGH